jgi:tripartite-type tricarboxylate transporter receptor subunit TctC
MKLDYFCLLLYALALAVLTVPAVGYGQGYPTKPIKLVVPRPAGGIADLRARVIAQRLGKAPDVRGHTAFAGAELDIWTPEEFAQYARKERPRWAQIVKAAGIAPQ